MAWRVEGSDIVIDGWEKGIADDPFSGIADMRNINITSTEKAASVQPKPYQINSNTTTSTTISAVDTVDNYITPTATLNETFYDGSSGAEGKVVVFTTSGTLPAGITAGTQYYIMSQAGTKWKLASSFANFITATPVDITSSGSGTHTITVQTMTTPLDSKTDPANPNATYLVDTAGNVWTSYTSLTLTRQWVLMISTTNTADANYTIAIYRGWLFRFRNRFIDVLDISGYDSGVNAGTWYYAWKTIATDMPHPAWVGSDDVLYWGDREVRQTTGAIDYSSGYVGSLRYNPRSDYSVATANFSNGNSSVNGSGTTFTSGMVGQYIATRNATGNGIYYRITGYTSATVITIESIYTGTTVTGKYIIVEGGLFRDTNDPTTSAQYTYNDKALDIPNGEYPTCFSELGSDLLIGTNTDKVYPWDRISDSFSLPLVCPEYYIEEMININNVVYIFSGNRGNVYKTNGVRITEAFRIPSHLIYSSVRDNTSKFIFWGDIKSSGDKIFFGVTGDDLCALMKYDVTRDVLTVEQDRIAASTTAASDDIVNAVCFYYDTSFSYLDRNSYSKKTRFGYSFVHTINLASTASIKQYQVLPDNTGRQGMYSSYEAFIITDCISVGKSLEPRTFQQVEVRMAQPLAIGEEVRVQYRLNKDGGQSGGFTTIGTMSYDSNRPTDVSTVFNADIDVAEYVQFKIALVASDSNVATPSSRTQLKELRIR